MSNPVGWFEIYVQDMPRAKAFYEGMLGVQLQKLPTPDTMKDGPAFEMWTFPGDKEEYGCGGALVKMEGVPKSAGLGTIVYFSSKDCAIEEKRVVSSGGKVERSKMPIGEYGFITLAFDTEGNMFGIHSVK